ncbi:MAG: GGDEF domain-containing protein [Gemmatimonadota bacterium]|nr:GGDEF domain-containing protein [Gemmatimonadota bacterium]
MTRASTMILALLFVHWLLGTLSLVVGRGMERPLALRYWGLGLLTYSAGLLIALPTGLPHDYNRVMSGAVVGFAAILTTNGLLQNSDSRLSWKWVGIGYALTIALMAANHLQAVYSIAFDYLAPAPFPNALFIFAIVALLRNPPPDAKTAARFLAGILIFVVTLWAARVWLMVASLGGTNDRDRMDFTISIFAIGQILIAISATLGLFWVEVRKMAAELLWLAGTDALTGLPNRRATLMRFQEEAARGMRHQRPYSIAIFDIDHFKLLNDAHGHAYGDEVLRQVGRELVAAKREVDVVGRFGGEEFVVILSEEGREGAATAAARFHERVKSVAGPEAGVRIPLTLSGGVATAPDDGYGWGDLFAAADRRLYEAKRSGRNKVISVGAGVTSKAVAADEDELGNLAPAI